MKTPNATDPNRSKIMRAVRGKNTAPEKIVRSILHKLGFRYRLHSKKLFGSPDIVLPKYKSVIFVHGCYWHSHPGCRYSSIPKSNTDYWTWKLKENRNRDKRIERKLTEMGWSVYIIWQCDLKKEPEIVVQKIANEITATKSHLKNT